MPENSFPRRGVRPCGAIALAALTLGIVIAGTGGSAEPPTGPTGKEPTVGGIALFEQWPGKGQQKPDAALILTGQTFGLLQPCGCSRPQKGGLERRAQFINTLKAKGWPVGGVDLGDLYPEKASFRDQGLLRYKTAMLALKEMGYIAIGLGKTEFSVEIDRILGEYAFQNQDPPYILAANLLGKLDGKVVPRAQRWPVDERRPYIEMLEVASIGSVPVGVVGIIGKSLAEEIEAEKLDNSVTVVKDANGKVNNGPVLKQAVAALAKHPKKPQLNVLLYQGSFDEAKKLAVDFPEFQAILCQAEDPEPPQYPTPVNGGKTLVIQVGHKGRNLGVLGAFAKQGGGFNLHYQLIPLDEYYITPGDDNAVRAANPILPILDRYAEQVRDFKFLADAPRGLHHAQNVDPKLHFVGSEACKACHAAEHLNWSKTHHGHALDTLEKVAKRPSLRNFDPECVRCHTVGFDYRTGFENEKKTPKLKHVGCENCHGPGSGHVDDPKNRKHLDLLSPWKVKPGDKLPVALIKKLAETKSVDRGKIAIPPLEQRMMNMTAGVCAKCHDPDNDPHFDFPTYWLKVNHTGLAPAGGWPGGAPKK